MLLRAQVAHWKRQHKHVCAPLSEAIARSRNSDAGGGKVGGGKGGSDNAESA
jgi:hypothetical protein